MFDLTAFTSKAGEYLKKAKEKVVEATNQTAETVARKATELTGRETTPDEVKKAALIAGAVVAGVAILGAVAGPQSTGVGGASGSDGFSGDWEGQATRFFAENGGSLNFETPYVDSEGQVYS